jgi:cell division septation protein DedD
MDALRATSAGFDNAQAIQSSRAAQNIAAPRERDGMQPLRPEQSPIPSTQVNLSEEARAAARSSASPPPTPVNTPAVPVQTQEAVVRAGSVANTDRVERQDAAAGMKAGQEAVQRYAENARSNLPAGQNVPSSVRVSA